jgi:hypothetical protein
LVKLLYTLRAAFEKARQNFFDRFAQLLKKLGKTFLYATRKT